MSYGKATKLRRAMTLPERILWRELRNHHLGYKFRRQAPYGPFILDFLCYEKRLVIEVDGGQHDGSATDATRDAWLRKKGFRVLRVWNNDVLGNPEGVAAVILAACIEGAAASPSLAISKT